MNRQCIKEAVATIAEGCGLDRKKVEAWLRPMMDPDESRRDAFTTLVTVITRGYYGKVEMKIDKEGRLVDWRLPDGVKPEQLKRLMDDVIREPGR